MNLVKINPSEQVIDDAQIIVQPTKKNFIEANTKAVDTNHLKKDCIIPVFSKDNESTISHFEFIDSVQDVLLDVFGHKNLVPEIRVSHEIKGRIPSAIGKPAQELMDSEKTIYYERMAFLFEIPGISTIVNGNKINLSVGGVRAYNQENLYSKKSAEKFKVFIGFQNKVCTNLCISTDGYKDDIRVSSISELNSRVHELIDRFDQKQQIQSLERMNEFSLTETQFAHLIGKMKLLPYLSKAEKQSLFALSVNDTQINIISRDYILDAHFSKSQDGKLSLWNLYNLFTEANKSNYIDNFIDRSVNAYEFVNHLGNFIENKQSNWFLL